MSDVARFISCPPLRCGATVPVPERPVCGRLAHWVADPPSGPLPVFHCAVHRGASDRLVELPVIVRRISLSAVVLFAGAGHTPAVARTDAVARLEEAVALAGGVLDVLNCTDALGRYEAPYVVTGGRPGQGRGIVHPLTD